MSTDLTVTPQPTSGGMVEAMSARQVQEAQAMVVSAKRFPRDEEVAIAKIRQACARPALAEEAFYKYTKGKAIIGPAIRLLEAIVRAWGNIHCGWNELIRCEGKSEVTAYCIDLETNYRTSRTFWVEHHDGKKPLTSDRDIYEKVANYAARRKRTCMMDVIPQHVQEIAQKACIQTLTGDAEEPLMDKVRRALASFEKIGVSSTMIERLLGHKISACDIHDLVNLRAIGNAIKDGEKTREDYFDVAADALSTGHDQQAEAAAAAREAQQQQPPAPETTPEPPKQDSEEDQEAAVLRNQLLEESGFGAMLAVADTLGKVDEVAAKIGADIRLDDNETATLLDACAARKKVIRAGRGSGSNK